MAEVRSVDFGSDFSRECDLEMWIIRTQESAVMCMAGIGGGRIETHSVVREEIGQKQCGPGLLCQQLPGGGEITTNVVRAVGGSNLVDLGCELLRDPFRPSTSIRPWSLPSLGIRNHIPVLV